MCVAFDSLFFPLPHISPLTSLPIRLPTLPISLPFRNNWESLPLVAALVLLSAPPLRTYFSWLRDYQTQPLLKVRTISFSLGIPSCAYTSCVYSGVPKCGNPENQDISYTSFCPNAIFNPRTPPFRILFLCPFLSHSN